VDFSLDKDQLALISEITEFAEKELNEGIVEADRAGTFRRELWLACGGRGLQGLPVPEEFGGRGLDPLSTMLAIEALGKGCVDAGLVFAVGAHLFGCTVPVWKFGSEEQKKKYLSGLCTGEVIGALAVTEPESGSDAFAMTTAASKDANGYRINGVKTLSTNGPVAHLVLLLALTDAKRGWKGGITCFLVDTGSEGVTRSDAFDMMGLRTARVGKITFEGVFVPEEAVLGKPGGGVAVFKEAMIWERVGINAGNIGTMERVLETCIDRARTRKQFGEPIGKFQAVSHRIADMKIRLEAARLITYKAAWAIGNLRDAMLHSSIAKVFASESFVKAALDCVEVFGGSGYLTENEVERVLRDAVGSTIYSGTSEIQRNIISKWLRLG
jgi:alkylation response protein AidB-like acyl-CoA dehydrogenase